MSIASENHSLLYVDDIFGVFETNEPVLKFLDILNHSLLYVDDIFGVFETNEPVLKFLDILNSQH